MYMYGVHEHEPLSTLAWTAQWSVSFLLSGQPVFFASLLTLI